MYCIHGPLEFLFCVLQRCAVDFQSLLRFHFVSFFQTCLRHPDCQASKQNRAGVFAQMRRALDMIQQIVTNGVTCSDSLSPTVNGDSGIGLATAQPTASRVLKDFDVSFIIIFFFYPH